MLTIIESPYVGDHDRNLLYARRAMMDSLLRGEFPFASHLLYTQVLDDDISADREMGILAGLAWARRAQLSALYTDYGITPGMQRGLEFAQRLKLRIVRRTIGTNPEGVSAHAMDRSRRLSSYKESLHARTSEPLVPNRERTPSGG